MHILEIEEFGGKKIKDVSHDDILLWISQKYPAGIGEKEIIGLNKELAPYKLKLPGEYASIYKNTTLYLEDYLALMKRTAKNHSVYTVGAITVSMKGHIPGLYKDKLITVDRKEAMSGVLFGHNTTDWLYSILLDQEEASRDSPYYLFSKTKTGKYRRLQRKEVIFFEKAMGALYMSPTNYSKVPHLWGRDVASFHYSYQPPENRKALEGKDVFLSGKDGYEVVMLLKIDGNNAIVERHGRQEIVSKYLVFNIGSKIMLDNYEGNDYA